MTDNRYPMALYPPKGEMLIVNDEQEHSAALASWEPVPEDVQPVVDAVEIDEHFAETGDNGPVFDPDWNEPETLDEAGEPIKRGPGRPRKVIP